MLQTLQSQAWPSNLGHGTRNRHGTRIQGTLNMKNLLLFVALLCLSAPALAVAAGSGEAGKKKPTEAGFVRLFNGKDLSGWILGPEKSWVVEGGAIALKREMDGK
jgi:hypothetical protein